MPPYQNFVIPLNEVIEITDLFDIFNQGDLFRKFDEGLLIYDVWT